MDTQTIDAGTNTAGVSTGGPFGAYLERRYLKDEV